MCFFIDDCEMKYIYKNKKKKKNHKFKGIINWSWNKSEFIVFPFWIKIFDWSRCLLRLKIALLVGLTVGNGVRIWETVDSYVTFLVLNNDDNIVLF